MTSPPPPAKARRISFTRAGMFACIPYALIVIACLGLAGLHTWAYPPVGPIDEQTHADYLYKLKDGHLLRLNELMGQEALKAESCRGVDSGYAPPPCLPSGKKYDATKFQFGGVSAAAGHTPIYYAVVAVAAAPISVMPGIEDYLSAARIASAVWLGFALCLLWWLLRLYGTPRSLAACIITLLGFTPAVIHGTFTLNPDATALPAGVLILAAVLRWRSYKVLMALSALAVWLKATNIIGVVVGALLLLLLTWDDQRTDANGVALSGKRLWIDRFKLPVAMGVASIIATVIWTTTIFARALPLPESAEPIKGATPTVLGSMFQFFTPISQAPLPPFFTAGEWVRAAQTYTNLVILISCFGAAMFLPWKTFVAKIGWAGVAGMVLGPAIIMASIRIGANDLFSPPSRYGLSIVPFLIMPLALAGRGRLLRVALLGLTLVTVGVTVNALVQSPYKKPAPKVEPAAAVAAVPPA